MTHEEHLAALGAAIKHAGEVADEIWERYCRADAYLADLTFVREVLLEQEPLGKEFETVLHDNLPDLYVR